MKLETAWAEAEKENKQREAAKNLYKQKRICKIHLTNYHLT